MNKPTWKKRIAAGVMSVALLGGAFHTGNQLEQSQTEIANEVGAAKATNFSKTTYQTTHNLNLRSGASTKHRVHLTIPKGGKVTSTSRVGNWYKVSYKGKTGYVSGTYLKKVSSTSTTTSSTTSYKTKSSVALKPGKHRTYKTVLTIPKGKSVTFVKAYGSWTKVKYAGKVGYVPTANLTKGSVANPTPSTPVASLYSTKKVTDVKPGKHRSYKTLVTVPKGNTVTFVKRYGSWAKIKYGNTTGYVPFAYIQKGKAPVSKPTTKPSEPTKVTYKVMTRAEGEKHLSKWMNKNGSTFELKVADGAVTPVVVKLTDSKTARGTLMLDVVSYMSMNEAKPEHFGMEDYLGQKKDLAVVNSTIKAFAETQFGVNTPETRRVIAELQKSYKYDENINKTITLQGKKVQLNGGIGSFELTVL